MEYASVVIEYIVVQSRMKLNICTINDSFILFKYPLINIKCWYLCNVRLCSVMLLTNISNFQNVLYSFPRISG